MDWPRLEKAELARAELERAELECSGLAACSAGAPRLPACGWGHLDNSGRPGGFIMYAFVPVRGYGVGSTLRLLWLANQAMRMMKRWEYGFGFSGGITVASWAGVM